MTPDIDPRASDRPTGISAEAAMRAAAIARKHRLWSSAPSTAEKPSSVRPVSPFTRIRLEREAAKKGARPPVNLISPPSWRMLYRLVSLKYGISVEVMLSDSRQADVVTARHAAVFLLYTHTGMSMPQIGKLIGRDHTSILNSIRVVESNRPDNRRRAKKRYPKSAARAARKGQAK